jgi:AmmeMemoRadiSam system protein A
MSHPLIDLARAAIAARFGGQTPYISGEGEDLACFVTLWKDGELRGCIGSLRAERPLAEEVAQRAVDAAFHDPRFPPLRPEELDQVDIEISVLQPPEPLEVMDEADLLRKLRPGVDGLILADGSHRATFLPSVWEQLPAPRDFVRQLKRKAGLSADHWSATLRFERYGAEKLCGDA